VLAQRVQLPGMRETQLLISYRNSAIVMDDRPGAATALIAAGDRMPDAGPLSRRYMERQFSLHERLGRGRHVLIGYIGNDPAWHETFGRMLAVLRQSVGEAASGAIIMPQADAVSAREDNPVLHDTAGIFAATFEASVGTVWLVRPDGYIGWCTETPTIDGLRAALERLH
jgi:hypothetical protein